VSVRIADNAESLQVTGTDQDDIRKERYGTVVVTSALSTVAGVESLCRGTGN